NFQPLESLANKSPGVVDQNSHFSANCNCRGARARLMRPKSDPSVMLPSGFRNWVWLSRLKNSARNSKLWRSVMGVVLCSAKSQFPIPGPQQIVRFEFTNVPNGTE